MNVTEFITKYHSILEAFQKIILIQDGEFSVWGKSYFTLQQIAKQYGKFKIRYNVYQTDVAFLALEETGKVRGGLTVKAYLYKIRNVLPLLNGIVIWEKKYRNKKLELKPNNLSQIETLGIGLLDVENVKITRDLYVLIRVRNEWQHGVKIDRIKSYMEGNRNIRVKAIKKNGYF